MTQASVISELDPIFTELAKAIYGDIMDPRELWDLAKLDGSDVHVNAPVKVKKKPPPNQDPHSNTARALVIGGAAEGLGTFRAGQKAVEAVKAPAVARAVGAAGKMRALGGGGAGKVGEFGLQAANLGIGLIAARKLSQHAKQPVVKVSVPLPKFLGKFRPISHIMRDEQAARHAALTGPATVAAHEKRSAEHVAGLARATRDGQRMVAGTAAVAGIGVGHHLGTRRRRASANAAEPVTKALRPVASAAAIPGAPTPLVAGVRASNSGGVGRGLGRRGRALGTAVTPAPKPLPLSKALTWTGEIAKVDDDKRQVFGWCSVVEVDGQPVVDRQGDYIHIDDVEKSAYTYVLESRKGGDMHARVRKGLSTEWNQPKHTADLIESVVFTPEKLAKMGLRSETGSLGWWVGFKVNDDEQWNLVKSGERTAFSIHGTGARNDAVLA